MTAIRVPASTANLGPGFDALGMALSILAEIGVIDDSTSDECRAKAVDEHHPASVAFARGDGRGSLWVSSPIPIGRGLGFSGAMRVGGAAVALARRLGDDVEAFMARRGDLLAVAAELEGHADNAAASLYGGFVATNGALAVRLETPLRPDVVVWIPSFTTSTATSRTVLPGSVPFGDAVFNIGRTALLVAALAAGDIDALAEGTQDRLHQDGRLAAAEPSRTALSSGLAAGAWCGWLSGSGPTITLLAAPGDGGRVGAALPADGQTKVLAVDQVGTVIVAGEAIEG